MKKIAIVMGSDSDLPVVEKAMATLEKFGVSFEAHVYSAHRTPEEARAFALGAREKGFGAVIAAAGKAAHLVQWLQTRHCLSLESLSNLPRWTGWMHCFPLCRCQGECLWQR